MFGSDFHVLLCFGARKVLKNVCCVLESSFICANRRGLAVFRSGVFLPSVFLSVRFLNLPLGNNFLLGCLNNRIHSMNNFYLRVSLHHDVVRASRDGAVGGDMFNSFACAASLVKIVSLHAVRFAIVIVYPIGKSSTLSTGDLLQVFRVSDGEFREKHGFAVLVLWFSNDLDYPSNFERHRHLNRRGGSLWYVSGNEPCWGCGCPVVFWIK